jgi:predicted alpha/beta-fold hydrolase
MNYTATQIENAKKSYNAMMQLRTVSSFEPQYIGMVEAEQRCQYHNNIVNEILAGNKELEKEWKMFFLNEAAKLENQIAEKKAKLATNKEASSDILAPIKAAKKLGEFGKWLNTPGNPFRKEHFSKKYTQASVNAFLNH